MSGLQPRAGATVADRQFADRRFTDREGGAAPGRTTLPATDQAIEKVTTDW
ncbi:hypothetical protein [Streptomyces cirratus]|nr:hypothetical protein [Streptomyces cirratus]